LVWLIYKTEEEEEAAAEEEEAEEEAEEEEEEENGVYDSSYVWPCLEHLLP